MNTFADKPLPQKYIANTNTFFQKKADNDTYFFEKRPVSKMENVMIQKKGDLDEPEHLYAWNQTYGLVDKKDYQGAIDFLKRYYKIGGGDYILIAVKMKDKGDHAETNWPLHYNKPVVEINTDYIEERYAKGRGGFAKVVSTLNHEYVHVGQLYKNKEFKKEDLEEFVAYSEEILHNHSIGPDLVGEELRTTYEKAVDRFLAMKIADRNKYLGRFNDMKDRYDWLRKR